MCKLSTNANMSCNNAQMMDWDDLRYFLAVARAGSVTGAATELGVNHSTVSRRIQAFEKQHNFRLFERLPSGYALTQAGENIYPKALQMEQHAQSVAREMFGQDTRLQGRLRLTTSNYMANEIIMPHLHEFQAQYPDIELELLVSKSLQNMAARDADIAVRLTPEPPENLIGRRIGYLYQGIYVSKAYLEHRVDPDKVILWTQDRQISAWQKQHFPDSRTVLRVDNVSTIFSAVKAGMGIAQLPCAIADNAASLFRLDIELPPPAWGIWVLSHVDLRATARVRVCREFLIGLLQGYKPLFEGKQSRYIAL